MARKASMTVVATSLECPAALRPRTRHHRQGSSVALERGLSVCHWKFIHLSTRLFRPFASRTAPPFLGSALEAQRTKNL